MSNDLSTGRAKRKRSAKWIFLSAALIILGGLALFVFAAGDKAEADKLFTFECNSERVEFLNNTVLNYPDYPENVVVDLLFDDHRMIGADITYNDAENGFTRALINDTMQSGLTVTLTQ